MLKKFEFEFEDESSTGSITYEYSDDPKPLMTVVVENGTPVMYANRESFLLLAKTCAKIALSEYTSGFHLHFNTNFDSDLPEAIRLVLNLESEAD